MLINIFFALLIRINTRPPGFVDESMATSSFSLNLCLRYSSPCSAASRRDIFNVFPQHLGVRRTSKVPARLVETGWRPFSARLAVPLAGPSPPTSFSSTVPSLSCFNTRRSVLWFFSLLTALQGSSSGFISRGSCLSDSPPIEALAVPLLCSVPRCRRDPFHPFSWLFVVACCTGWASTARTNNSHAFHIPRTHPPCTLWEPAWILGLLQFFAVALVGFYLYPTTYKATIFTFCSWLKGNRPDNGDIEPSKDQPKKIYTSLGHNIVCCKPQRITSSVGLAWCAHALFRAGSFSKQ